ncbi:hypothetical protein SLEP1_g30283 [Rubroshorea leprosula]|uniref:Uncharacterized protein n=1 Tax=Rubroshorea leprosula TaxID=152421 RepID=A0AAV5K6B2_9ROSI|nr:hypothetical protein SLEP1_g30283 [Rubroshorea leprosula]
MSCPSRKFHRKRQAPPGCGRKSGLCSFLLQLATILYLKDLDSTAKIRRRLFKVRSGCRGGDELEE